MSSSAQDAPPQLNLGNTFGALFIGVILAAVLFGLTNVQAFIYLQAHRSAGITFFKLVVAWLWIFDALHLALTIHAVYYYLVANYGNFSVLAEIVWSLKLQLVINGTVLVFSSGVAIPLVWEQYKTKFFTDLTGIIWTTYLALGAATFIDILIASLLCYFLATSRTGFSRTDSFITKLVGYTVSTGCLTSICSMLIIITCIVMPKTFIFISLQFLVTKLYVNSFIAFLNARYYMQTDAIVELPQSYERHVVYHAELHSSPSQDEGFQKSEGDPNGEVLHLTQPIQAAMVGGFDIVDGRGLIDALP
ncbi:uncharacterized protein EDB93DRAFT_1251955 [Suillus bovinus]|uniref:uncharacterized protein n=1 Tax=Suillus bovinus TaxID=48563 RepID=UPI001B86F6C9|nr:uncharacterized protein EDB93DRAFT_1251955 [Suillus bovinus]KAG2143537.1 hypothetical protein EDB93DRAFT_1251955 [Suillus bovinus]